MSDFSTLESRATSDEWVSVHFFYNGSLNQILKNGVAPLIKDLNELNLLSNFFFIRYWEYGPHIRLRLKPNGSNSEIDSIKSIVYEKMSNFFECNPVTEDIEMDNATNSFSGLIRYIDYVPEIERYGGRTGIYVAEQLFQASSIVVLDILESKDQMSYDDSIAAAIQLNISFALSFGMTVQEAVSFYNMVYTSMLPKARLPGINELNSVPQLFSRLYIAQKEQLTDFVTSFIAELRIGNNMFDEPSINGWIRDCQLISQKFHSKFRAGGIFIPDDISEQMRNAQILLKDEWFIFNSYVHMTNNRLGIHNSDESYLAFLISNSLHDYLGANEI